MDTFPLTYGTEREAQRSALAWYVIYEEEFAGIRFEVEHGKRVARSAPTSKPLSEFTLAEMHALIKPVSESVNRGQHSAIATGAMSHRDLTDDHAKPDT